MAAGTFTKMLMILVSVIAVGLVTVNLFSESSKVEYQNLTLPPIVRSAEEKINSPLTNLTALNINLAGSAEQKSGFEASAGDLLLVPKVIAATLQLMINSIQFLFGDLFDLVFIAFPELGGAQGKIFGLILIAVSILIIIAIIKILSRSSEV